MVTIPVTFTGGQTTVVVTVSDDGWLGGIQLRPAGQEEEPAGPWQPPPYADPGSFREQEVTLGTGPLAVPGTLTLPRQGGVAPRVATAGPPVAGLVIMAGGAEPLHWAMVRQFRYLAALDPSPLAAPQQVLAAVTRQAELVDSPDLSPATPAADLPFAVPAAYWLDLRGYDPPAAAAALAKPVLLLQGGRDYQVTVADDLSRWRTGLAGRPDVTVHVYEADNHLFFPGSGRSAPAEYEPAQHLDPAVVADIAAWLASTAPGGQAGSADPGGSLPLG